MPFYVSLENCTVLQDSIPDNMTKSSKFISTYILLDGSVPSAVWSWLMTLKPLFCIQLQREINFGDSFPGTDISPNAVRMCATSMVTMYVGVYTGAPQRHQSGR